MKNGSETALFSKLGLALKILRELKGMNQSELARKAGLGKCQLSKYETGRELPKLDSLEKALIALDAKPSALFFIINCLERLGDGTPDQDALREASLDSPLMTDPEEHAFAQVNRALLDLFSARAEEKVRRESQLPAVSRRSRSRRPKGEASI